jgi:hypothetical protein
VLSNQVTSDLDVRRADMVKVRMQTTTYTFTTSTITTEESVQYSQFQVPVQVDDTSFYSSRGATMEIVSAW